jgi:intracellular sulfur oxidation DsrE/DsrF family protein
MIEQDEATHRRGFIGRLIAGAVGVVAASGGALRAAAQATRPPEVEATDERWIRSLKGKQRLLLDMQTISSGHALRNARAYLNVYHEAYKLTDADVNAIIGVNASAVPVLFNDDLWERYRLGEKTNLTDPRTKLPSLRNPFLNPLSGDAVPAEASIPALQKRGVLFLLCNNSFSRLVGELATQASRNPVEMRAELLAGLVPGVVIVPAMAVSIERAQKRGISYKFVS